MKEIGPYTSPKQTIEQRRVFTKRDGLGSPAAALLEQTPKYIARSTYHTTYINPSEVLYGAPGA